MLTVHTYHIRIALFFASACSLYAADDKTFPLLLLPTDIQRNPAFDNCLDHLNITKHIMPTQAVKNIFSVLAQRDNKDILILLLQMHTFPCAAKLLVQHFFTKVPVARAVHAPDYEFHTEFLKKFSLDSLATDRDWKSLTSCIKEALHNKAYADAQVYQIPLPESISLTKTDNPNQRLCIITRFNTPTKYLEEAYVTLKIPTYDDLGKYFFLIPKNAYQELYRQRVEKPFMFTLLFNKKYTKAIINLPHINSTLVPLCSFSYDFKPNPAQVTLAYGNTQQDSQKTLAPKKTTYFNAFPQQNLWQKITHTYQVLLTSCTEPIRAMVNPKNIHMECDRITIYSTHDE